jgi:hypothetical protein
MSPAKLPLAMGLEMRASYVLNRSQFLKGLGVSLLMPFLSDGARAAPGFWRVRPGDPDWPDARAWRSLKDQVGGRLVSVNFPLSVIQNSPESDAAKALALNLKNPYFISDEPGLTQTLGWVDAWTSKPSVYAVAARNSRDIAATVNFAREKRLRLVIKGRGHSYKGQSNAPDSLMIWTRHMSDIRLNEAFVPQGCAGKISPQPAVTVGAGVYGLEAYDAVTTKTGKYLQGGGCLTVGLAGLILGGGFGSFSKHYGMAAASLLEAEVVTADGKVRIANASSNPDLFWALKGGGGTFCVVSRMTLKLHDLPDYFGAANFTIKASTDDAYRRLVRKFVSFYRERLFNHHWGEQVHFTPDNRLVFRMDHCGLDSEKARATFEPLFDFIAQFPSDYSQTERVVIFAVPARHWWDPPWWSAHWPEVAFPPTGIVNDAIDLVLEHIMTNPVMSSDGRPGANPRNVWWTGSTDEVGEVLWGYESLWLPQALLADDAQSSLADALFVSSRLQSVGLHFNKALAGAPAEAVAAARDTAINPAVLSAFALVIVADGEGPAYPGIKGHEPDVRSARAARARIARCMNILRALVPKPGAYFNESNYFEHNWQDAYWGDNYRRLLSIKKTYDPDGLFYAHDGVGSEDWSADGFQRV